MNSIARACIPRYDRPWYPGRLIAFIDHSGTPAINVLRGRCIAGYGATRRSSPQVARHQLHTPGSIQKVVSMADRTCGQVHICHTIRPPTGNFRIPASPPRCWMPPESTISQRIGRRFDGKTRNGTLSVCTTRLDLRQRRHKLAGKIEPC